MHLPAAISTQRCPLGSIPVTAVYPPLAGGDSASSADPTSGYHLQTWIADAVSGTSNTTNTQHGLAALALGLSSPEAVPEPSRCPSLRAGAGPALCSADGAVASAAAAAPQEPRGRSRSQHFGNGIGPPAGDPGNGVFIIIHGSVIKCPFIHARVYEVLQGVFSGYRVQSRAAL